MRLPLPRVGSYGLPHVVAKREEARRLRTMTPFHYGPQSDPCTPPQTTPARFGTAGHTHRPSAAERHKHNNARGWAGAAPRSATAQKRPATAVASRWAGRSNGTEHKTPVQTLVQLLRDSQTTRTKRSLDTGIKRSVHAPAMNSEGQPPHELGHRTTTVVILRRHSSKLTHFGIISVRTSRTIALSGVLSKRHRQAPAESCPLVWTLAWPKLDDGRHPPASLWHTQLRCMRQRGEAATHTVQRHAVGAPPRTVQRVPQGAVRRPRRFGFGSWTRGWPPISDGRSPPESLWHAQPCGRSQRDTHCPGCPARRRGAPPQRRVSGQPRPLGPVRNPLDHPPQSPSCPSVFSIHLHPRCSNVDASPLPPPLQSPPRARDGLPGGGGRGDGHRVTVCPPPRILVSPVEHWYCGA